MEAVSSELTFFTLPNCFELFGFDFLVDESWNVWLLEVSPPARNSGIANCCIKFDAQEAAKLRQFRWVVQTLALLQKLTST